MPIVLSLLDAVRWNGEPVVGDRPQALLAALADAGRVVRAETLVEQVWGEDVPAVPAKALQVLVSRTRSACGPDAVVRDGDGYRLGIAAAAVDSTRLAELAAAARVGFERDPATAVRQAREALGYGAGLVAAGESEGPLADVRRHAALDLRTATVALARALSRLGDHAEALPGLEAASAEHPDDEGLLADLLRSEGAVRGAGAALERYEAHRIQLRDRLGADPGAELRRLHAELLALDSPVREGVQYEATSLLGREQDIRRLHALLGTSRVVSILGPGGLGKTRLAHVLGRDAAQPVVHFVELVGVTAADDLIGEVGSALGVRDSVSGRRALTPEQRADVRARIAQHLDQTPSLLILDNCEHIVAAVADLVAYLVATTRTLRVLTTTRSPLAISAETVYPLGELDVEDAVELFRQRAVAARPDVQIDDAVVDIVRRLDGLPLAIELAAAKVRVMSTADIARRLENRFALLRGGDRSAPDRHQTLLAVIDWSWNLLGEPERHALRWLSVFHDGFSLEGAEALLGATALDALQDLSDQSLVSVLEADGAVRYRMLETVREFGRMQLVDADEDVRAAEAHRRWAVDLCLREGAAIFGAGQFEAVDALRAEESNLADVLRQALVAADPVTVVQVLSALGCFWSILGDHARVIVLADAVTSVVGGWQPPDELAAVTRVALVMTLNNAMIGSSEQSEQIRAVLRELGPGEDDPRIAATVQVVLAFDPSDLDGFLGAMAEFGRSADRNLAMMAEQMRSHALENSGEPAEALAAAEHALALARPEDGPWLPAILHTQIAQLMIQRGDRDGAVLHAREAIPTLERLRAMDDALQLRSLLVLAAVGAGDLDRAALELERLSAIDDSEAVFGGQLVIHLGEAELALALGEVDRGLELYRASIERVRAIEFPGIDATGLEPWVFFGEATALSAYAQYGADPGGGIGPQLFDSCRAKLRGVLDPDYPYLDYPVCGLVFFGVGTWGLLQDGLPVEDAVRLLVLAERFAYNRTVPTMAWDRIVRHVEERAPGVLEKIQAEYGDRRGPDLLEDARAFVTSL
ncbi:transcriptional regulator [Nocardioides marmoriginsengisoli]|uniref:Transcriptional regulator n=1 Tax=Nocardioides marmoriginsengisoli TaxID=661483 RepID=A0A3N0CFN4_9ACTN|nr:BTAD domain-containing putative transcriptional regulator [Nocardioides marmoriginsengisoli]RNL62109.1 transcriptional regulator [Nocardioides marmoriginsengisoli]